MQTKEWYTHDKSKWGEGPWQHEPDKMQYEDPETGLPCLIKRNCSGALCGYVGVAEGHPLFQKDFNDVDLEAHRGLSYSNFCIGGEEDNTICHVPDEGEPDRVWWLGYDCAHYKDKLPGLEATLSKIDSELEIERMFPKYVTYRDLEYVKTENARLAKQIKEVEENERRNRTNKTPKPEE